MVDSKYLRCGVVREKERKKNVCPRHQALNKRVSGTVTRRALSVRVAGKRRKRSLQVGQRGIARKQQQKNLVRDFLRATVLKIG